MTPHNELRLLPWSGPDGNPCYLSTDNSSSCLADNTEAIQLGLAADLVAHALEVLSDEEATTEELRLLTRNPIGALRDTLRVAASRGHRLESPCLAARDGGDEGPRLPAAAFG